MSDDVKSLVSDDVALVTGASSGIGAAAALAFASSGIEVAAVARSATRSVSQDLPPKVRSALHPIDADLTVPEEIHRVFEEVGPIRIIVHSVGFDYDTGWFANAPPDDVVSAVASLISSPALVLNRGLNAMSHTGGTIGLVSSGAANKLTPGRALYSASKSAVNRLVESVAAECAVHSPDIGVYAISPGRVNTPAQDRLINVAATAPEVFGLESFRSSDNVHEAADVGGAITKLAQREPGELNGGIFRYRPRGWEKT